MNILARIGFLCYFCICFSGCQQQTTQPTDEIQEFRQLNQTSTVPLSTPKITVTQTQQLTSTTAPTQTPSPVQPTKTIKTTQSLLSIQGELTQNIEQIIAQTGGRWHIIIKEIDGSDLYILEPERRINIASVVKVPLALLFFEALEQKEIPEGQLREYLQTRGTGGRTFDQLLRAMLVKSEEDATEILDEYIRATINVPIQLAEWDLTSLDLVSRRYTPTGIAAIFENLYLGKYVNPTAREILLEYLNEYTPNDDLRIGVLLNLLPTDHKIYNKRGSLLTPYVVADCAIIENPNGTDYLLIQFAYNSEPKTTYEALEAAQADIALAFWDTIKTQNQP